MKRRLFHAAAGASLVILIALGTLVLWSCWRFVTFQVLSSPRGVWMVLSDGGIRVELHDAATDESFEVYANSRNEEVVVPFLMRGGDVTRVAGGTSSPGKYWTVSAWVCLIPFTVVPLWWLWRRPNSRELRRSPYNFCPACGYDLRGTPPSNPCPECGATGG
jgi:hypothetical protein